MAHRLYWIDEPWIMSVDYSEVIGAKEVDEVMGLCIAAAEKHPIYFIVDVTGAKSFEPALLKSTSTIKLLSHGGTRWFAFIGMNSVIRMAVAILMRFAGFKAFATREEGLTFLHEMVQQEKDKLNQPHAAG